MNDFSLLRNWNCTSCVHAAVFWCFLTVCSPQSKSRASLLSSKHLYKASLLAASLSLYRPQYLSIPQNSLTSKPCSAAELSKNVHHGLQGPFVQNHSTTYNLHTISSLAIAFQKSAIQMLQGQSDVRHLKCRTRLLWSVRRSDVICHDQKHEANLPVAQILSRYIFSMLLLVSLA